MRLRTKIQLAFSITIVCMLALLGTISSVESSKASMELVNNSIMSSTALASSQISDKFSSCLKIVSFIGSNLAANNTDLTNSETMLAAKSTLDKYVESYGFTDVNLLNTQGVSLIDGTDFSDRDYVKTALSGTQSVSDITLNEFTNTYGVSVAAPLYNSASQIIGVIYFRLDTNFIQEILNNIQISPNSYAYLIDASGNIVSHPNEELILNYNLSEQSPEMKRIASSAAEGQTGTGSYTYESKSVLCGYAPVAMTNGLCLVIAAPQQDFTAGSERVTKIMLALDITALIVSLIISTMLAIYISGPITCVKDALIQIAKGDFSYQIPTAKGRDEVAVLQNTAASLLNILSDIMGNANTVLSNIAACDLTSKNMPEYPGDFNILAKSVNSIKVTLRGLISQIQHSIYNVEVSSHELAEAANALSEGTLVQANSIQTLVHDLDDVVSRINKSSENETLVNEQLKSLDKQIQTGGQQMKELLGAVGEIEIMSSDIAKIVETIDSIAFQTNILSLNASVEAAHAGEMGKGFAVVAEEVRSLAEKCGDASQRTSELITECINSIVNAKSCADGTFGSLSEIVNDSAQISNAFVQIVDNTSEQAAKSNRIQEEIKNISDVVQTHTATAEETAASTQLLSQQADELKKMIARFRV